MPSKETLCSVHPDNKEIDNILHISIFILAGGRGSRLRSNHLSEIASSTKLMTEIELANKPRPMIAYTLDGILGISGKIKPSPLAILTANHPDSDPEAIESYVKNHQAKGIIDLEIVREPKLLGTAGAVYNALKLLRTENTVIICPGDVLYPYSNLFDLVEAHYHGGTSITWAVTSQPGEGAQNSGRLWINSNSMELTHSYESSSEQLPTPPNNISFMTSVGVVVIESVNYLNSFRLFKDEIHQETPDLYRSYIPWVLSKGEKVLTYDIATPAPDLGTSERLMLFGRKNNTTNQT